MKTQSDISRVSIIGIGDEAGRIINKMQVSDLPETELCAFGMNRGEISELPLFRECLIDNDDSGEGQNMSLAGSEGRKSLPQIKKVLTNKIMSVFVVCLGDRTGEGCIKTFLQKSIDTKLEVKILVVTLLHSESVEKRKDAIKLLKELEPMADGIFKIDYGNLSYNTISDLCEEVDRKIIKVINTLVDLTTHPQQSIVGLDFRDIKEFFLSEHSDNRYIDFFTSEVNKDFLDNAVKDKDIRKIFPPNFLSLKKDVSEALLSIKYHQSTDGIDLETIYLIPDYISTKFPSIDMMCEVRENTTMPQNILQTDLFVKYS